MRHGARFGNGQRLLKRREFRRVQRRGRRRVGRFLIVISSRGAQQWTRIGLTVSRKVGNAVIRNRVKRRLREIYRRNREAFPERTDLVWIARAQASEASYTELENEAIELSQPSKRKRRKRRRQSGSRGGGDR